MNLSDGNPSQITTALPNAGTRRDPGRKSRPGLRRRWLEPGWWIGLFALLGLSVWTGLALAVVRHAA